MSIDWIGYACLVTNLPQKYYSAFLQQRLNSFETTGTPEENWRHPFLNSYLVKLKTVRDDATGKVELSKRATLGNRGSFHGNFSQFFVVFLPTTLSYESRFLGKGYKRSAELPEFFYVWWSVFREIISGVVFAKNFPCNCFMLFRKTSVTFYNCRRRQSSSRKVLHKKESVAYNVNTSVKEITNKNINS